MIWCHIAFGAIVVTPPDGPDSAHHILVLDDQGEPMAGQTVTVVHRPSTPFHTEVAVGITDGRGGAPWTPTVPGPYVVSAGGQELNGSLPFERPPLDAALSLLALLAAAVLSVGYGIRSRPRRPPRGTPDAHRPRH